MSAMIQGGVIGRLVKRFGEPQLIAGSLVVVGLSLLIIPFAATVSVLLIGLGDPVQGARRIHRADALDGQPVGRVVGKRAAQG